MNAYALWAEVRALLREQGRPDDPQRDLNSTLATIARAEDDVIATVGGPVMWSYIPSAASTTTLEVRLGQETYPADTDDTRVESDETIYNALQPWTYWASASPILDGQILEVGFRRTSGSDYETLEETSVEELTRSDGVDFESTGHGSVPSKWYVRQLHDQAGTGLHTTVLGLYPNWVTGTADSQAIRIQYLPRALPYPVIYGTGIASTGTTAVSQYVNVSSGSATVFFKSTHVAGKVSSAATITAALNAATLSLPSGGLTAGMELGLVDRLGGLPRAWYVIRDVTTVADLIDYSAVAVAGAGPATQAAYANYIVGFTVQPAVQEISAGAWSVDHRFVISSPSLFGRSYGSRAQCIALLAAQRLARGDGDAERSQYLEDQYRIEILRTVTGIYRRNNHASDY